MAKSKYLLLTDDARDGAEAQRFGLVSPVTEADELQAKAKDVAIRLAGVGANLQFVLAST